MIWNRLIKAGLIGFVMSAPLVTDASAQSVLRELRGATSNQISVSVNRAIVMEADRPFAELSVANPGIADIATLGERTIYVLGRSPGRTTLTILGPEGELISNVEVAVTPDTVEFKERLREILPNEPIEVRTAGGGLILSGNVSGARKVSRALELAERYAPGGVTNLMMVGGSQQVMLKVRFAEVVRSVSKGLGVNAALGIDGDAALYSGANAVSAFGGDGGTLGAVDSVTFTEGTNALGTIFSIGDVAVGLLIDALETKGMARTLAEPNIVAVSGEEASFLAGGEFPVPVQGEDGVSIEFKRFGIVLDFTPTVIDGNLIRLELDTEVSNPQVFAEGTGISSRSASTVVEMKDGQSFAIAGLLRDTFDDDINQVPWLGDIPVIGSLFRSTSYLREQSELVIIITPHLVSPVDGDLLSLPTDRIAIPSELELFLNGNVSGTGAVNDVARQNFQGSYGYVME
ncbi:type II and III secretion system protein family protein [Oceanibium sediminis]|uniref:type II and III secretion system protein family protein n=1 Tax=Oceanibium sediminis TaxID=2026339 RepID=UPI000DD33DB4